MPLDESDLLETTPASRQIGRPAQDRAVRESSLTRFLRQRILNRLGRLEGGRIVFADDHTTAALGNAAEDGLTAQLHVHDPMFYRRLAQSGSLGFAESYLRGEWSSPDLTALLRILTRNLDQLQGVDRGPARIARLLAEWGHTLARNTRRGSRRNIASHYDLSNEFFAMFLDPKMMYSSAMFDDATETLEQASLAKLDAVCRKLDLRPNDHVLEIGSGWGGYAIYAARNYGCRVTTTTISRHQYEFAKERIDSAGLGDRVTLLFDDYRDLTGTYDKLVSIEMLEAVGHQFFGTYFETCNRLLRRGGRMVVQTITIPEQRYADYLRSVDFIQKYIFPGGCLPSLAAVQEAVGKHTEFRLLDQDDFGLSYARTLSEWRASFFDRITDVRRLGFDERFIRMWDYYLCYCEAAFLERAVGVSHLTWLKV